MSNETWILRILGAALVRMRLQLTNQTIRQSDNQTNLKKKDKSNKSDNQTIKVTIGGEGFRFSSKLVIDE